MASTIKYGPEVLIWTIFDNAFFGVSNIAACRKIKVPQEQCGQSAKSPLRAVFHKVWEKW